jgi:hypothetical protein
MVFNNFALDTMTATGGAFNNSDSAYYGTSKTISELTTETTYSDPLASGGLGWQFGNDDEHPWKMPESGTGYPILYWQEWE